MTGLRAVVALTGSGLGPEAVARRLGLRVDAVAVLLDQATRLGLAEPAAGGCAGCTGGTAARLGCAGCPLVRSVPVAPR